jgi:hypothetical protein
VQLERIAAVVRPRRPWEAVDLGFMMARAWWPQVARAWLAIVAPFAVVAAVAIAVSSLSAAPLWALVVVWWAKPLYDRVPLYVLSRALFGAVPGVREVVGTMPRLWLSQGFRALTLRRFDPMRSFLLPVGQLEGLQGADHGRRTAVLKAGAGETASWLTVACLVFELATFTALVGLLDMLRPEHVEPSFWQIFAFLGGGDAPAWYAWLGLGLYVLAVSLIEPFYVAGGFALYLNRRTQLEGWDVELAFRRLARRLQVSPFARAAAVLLAVSLATAGAVEAQPGEAQAEGTPRDPQEAVAEVLADPEFGSRLTEPRWRLRFEPEATSAKADVSLGFFAGLVTLLGQFFEVVMWALAAAVVAALVVAAVRRLALPRRLERPEDERGPTVIAGLDVSAESLPDDVPAAALAAWRAGRPEEALSLLYRGALAWLVERRRLPAQESWTEDDCLRHLSGAHEVPLVTAVAASPRETPLVDYFARLTRTWQRTAYAHRPPSDDEVQELASGWPVHFRAAAGARP